MKDINVVVIAGRVAKDAEFTCLASGTAKLCFSVAVNSPAKNPDGSWGEKASFIDVVVWGKLADVLKPHLAKGRKAIVEGRLIQDRWQDKQTGAGRSKVYITADNVQVEKPSFGGGQAVQQAQPRKEKPEMPPDEEIPFEDDWPEEVPF